MPIAIAPPDQAPADDLRGHPEDEEGEQGQRAVDRQEAFAAVLVFDLAAERHATIGHEYRYKTAVGHHLRVWMRVATSVPTVSTTATPMRITPAITLITRTAGRRYRPPPRRSVIPAQPATVSWTSTNRGSSRATRAAPVDARAPLATARRGRSVNASPSSASTTIQPGTSSSPSSCPGPHPAWPAKIRDTETPCPIESGVRSRSTVARPAAHRPRSPRPRLRHARGRSPSRARPARRRTAPGAGAPPRATPAEHCADLDLTRSVQHEPERPFVVVGEHEHDGASEVRIAAASARRRAAGH